MIRPGGIGDLIVSLPALEALRADYTEVWVAPPNLPLVRFADGVRAIPDTGLNLLEIPDRDPPAALLDDLRGFDSIVSWYGANREEFRRAAERHGLRMELLPALPDGRGHAVDFYLRQAGAEPGARPRIGCPRGNAQVRHGDRAVSTSARNRAATGGSGCAPGDELGGGGFVAIHPFSGSPKKNWPLERFRRVAEILDAQWCERRFEDLYDLGCWLAQARLFIGNDSGIAHLAAAVGTPVVALFGPTDPAVWAPRGDDVRVVFRPGPIDQITVEEVLAAATRSAPAASPACWPR